MFPEAVRVRRETGKGRKSHRILSMKAAEVPEAEDGETVPLPVLPAGLRSAPDPGLTDPMNGTIWNPGLKICQTMMTSMKMRQSIPMKKGRTTGKCLDVGFASVHSPENFANNSCAPCISRSGQVQQS